MHVISIKFIIIKTITDEKAKFKFGLTWLSRFSGKFEILSEIPDQLFVKK